MRCYSMHLLGQFWQPRSILILADLSMTNLEVAYLYVYVDWQEYGTAKHGCDDTHVHHLFDGSDWMNHRLYDVALKKGCSY